MYETKNLIENIRTRAKKQGYSLKSVAEASGLSQNILYNIKGEQGISCFNLAKIADTLECSTDELLGR